MNSAAHAIVAQNDGLLASSRGLHAERPSESAELERLIREAIHTVEGQGLSAGGGLAISRKRRSALKVLVSPVQNLPLDVARPLAAIVFVTDTDQKLRPHSDILRAVYGLTPAECRVTMLICDGKSPREIAELLAVSPNTVKSQVSTIYAKTSTSSHAQLVRVLLRLPGSLSSGIT